MHPFARAAAIGLTAVGSDLTAGRAGAGSAAVARASRSFAGAEGIDLRQRAELQKPNLPPPKRGTIK